MEYVYLLLLIMNFQDYFYIYQSFVLDILSDFWYWLNCDIFVYTEDITTLQKFYFYKRFYVIHFCFLLRKKWRLLRQWKWSRCFDIVPLNNADVLMLMFWSSNVFLFFHDSTQLLQHIQSIYYLFYWGNLLFLFYVSSCQENLYMMHLV